MDLETYLIAAIQRAEPITIIYDSGNKPGAARIVLPVEIVRRYSHPSLGCIDLELLEERAFWLSFTRIPADSERIWLVGDVEAAPLLDPTDEFSLERGPMQWPDVVMDDPVKDVLPFSVLRDDWLSRFATEFTHPHFSIDVNDDAIRIFQLFKNGKRHKYPVAAVEKMASVSVAYDRRHASTVRYISVPPTRPWWTVSHRFRSYTLAFDSFAKDAERLLEG